MWTSSLLIAQTPTVPWRVKAAPHPYSPSKQHFSNPQQEASPCSGDLLSATVETQTPGLRQGGRHRADTNLSDSIEMPGVLVGQAEICISEALDLTVRLSFSHMPRDCASHDPCHQPGPGPILGNIPMGGCRNHGECATPLPCPTTGSHFSHGHSKPHSIGGGGVEENGKSALTPISFPPHSGGLLHGQTVQSDSSTV